MRKNIFPGIIILFFLTGCIQTSPLPETPTKSEPTSTTSGQEITQTPAVNTIRFPTSTVEPPLDVDCKTMETREGLHSYYQDGKLARIGRGRIQGIDWSSDGRVLAIASETGIYFLDAVTMQELNYIDSGTDVDVIKFSPDGKMVATDAGYKVAIWDISTGRRIALLGEYLGFYAGPYANSNFVEFGNISFSPDSQQIAVHVNRTDFSTERFGVEDRRVQVWDIASNQLVREWKDPDTEYSPYKPDPVYSPDGKTLATPWIDGIHFMNPITGENSLMFQGSNYAIISPDGKHVVSGINSDVVLYHMETKQTIIIAAGTHSGPASAYFSPDSRRVITEYSSNDYSYVDVWDVSTGEHRKSLTNIPYLGGMAFNSQADEIVFFDYYQNIYVWNYASDELVRTFSFTPYLGSDALPTRDGLRLVVKNEGSYHLYDAVDGKFICQMPGTATDNEYLSFNPYGAELATFKRTGEITVWDTDSGEIVYQLQEDGPIPDGAIPLKREVIDLPEYETEFVAWAWVKPDGTAERWIDNSCAVLEGLPSQCKGVISRDGRYVAISRDYSIIILNTYTKQRVTTIKEGVNNFIFSPDGRDLITLRFIDFSVGIWRVNSGQNLLSLNEDLGGEGPILGMHDFTFSDDGRLMVTFLPYFRHDAIKVWDTKNWTLVRAFNVTGGVGLTRMSGEGDLVVGLSGYVIYLWHLDEN
jgi:WD40 repeat protein